LSDPQKNKEYVSLILLLAVFIFSGLTAAKLVGYALYGSPSNSVSGENSAANGFSEENLKAYQEQTKEVTSALKKKNLFYASPKPPGPPTSCQAIFGDEAYIDGKWVGVGAKLKAGAILKKIEATYVIIEHEGKEKKLAPIAVAESSGPKAAKPKSSESKSVPSSEKKGEKTKEGKGEVVKSASGGSDDLSWFDADVSPETRAKLEQMWAMMPDAMKENAKQEWLKMTDEQKEKAIEELENMPDDALEKMEEQMQRRNR
jgi:hypothetical protein